MMTPCTQAAEEFKRRLAPAARAPAGVRVVRLAPLLIILVTVFAFVQVVRNEFVDWDDNYLIVQNEAYRGLSWGHMRWMFTTGLAGHYQPLTWLSYAIESRVWGVNAAGFHMTNLLLHVATCIGFFFVTRQLLARFAGRSGQQTRPMMTSPAGCRVCGPDLRDAEACGSAGSGPAGSSSTGSVSVGASVGALAAALLFAVHPLRVESVAWATERRDVLSGAWLMLTLMFYLRAVDAEGASHRRSMLILSLVCYVLSLLSKAAGITLPVVLLLLDVYPLRRLGRSGDSRRVNGEFRMANSEWRILLEKLPYLGVAFLIGLAALWAQSQAGALRTAEEHSVALRIGQTFYGIMFYLWKSVWPTGLIPLYEQNPHATPFDLANVLSACIAVGLTWALWLFRRRQPALLVAWGVYIVLLLPVLGLAQSGPQLVADRYSYLSCMPWALLAGACVACLWERASPHRKAMRVLTSAAVLVIVVILTILTRSQTRVWADSYKLWTTVIERAPRTGTAHANLAAVLNGRGDHEEARRHSLTALEILPGNRTAHIALARSSAQLGNLATAEKHYEIALRIRPGDPGRLIDLALVKSRLSKFDDAEVLYRRAVDLEPDSPTARFNLGSFLASRGRGGEAILFLERAARLDPDAPASWFRLAVVLLTLDEPAAAIEALESGLAYTPDNALLNTKLAWVLATCRIDELRDGPRAVELARQAVTREAGSPLKKYVNPVWHRHLAGENVGFRPAPHLLQRAASPAIASREALAAALAEVGDFKAAVDTLDELLAGDTSRVPQNARERLASQLARYRKGQPARE